MQGTRAPLNGFMVNNHTHGWVDGVEENELRGWIVNYSRPSRPEYIVCTGERGKRRFFPTVMRADVNATLGVQGVFGFSVPVDLLEPVGQRVTITDTDGRILEQGRDIDVGPVLSPLSQDTITNLFLHIPKTAGSSLRQALLGQIPAGKKLLLYPGRTPGIPPESLNRIPLYQRSQLRWVFGHYKFGLGRLLLQSCRYVTFVRETTDRLRSNFNHHAAVGALFEIGGEFLPASTVINEGLTEEFDNMTTRTLSGLDQKEAPLGTIGDDELELALHNVRQNFYFIGRQRRASEDLKMLQGMLDIKACDLGFDNVTPNASQFSQSDTALVDWPRVMERNRIDERLYQVLEEGNLLSRRLRN